MRVSRTVLGGALGETPEVYSLHDSYRISPLAERMVGYQPGYQCHQEVAEACAIQTVEQKEAMGDRDGHDGIASHHRWVVH
jgi:hypothetical protein